MKKLKVKIKKKINGSTIEFSFKKKESESLEEFTKSISERISKIYN